ncbi:hypothetical protein HF086_014537 [Spodoptera exigua]|uniref:Protein ecdysoneless n=1 Tax=Spodoptera exigua TaxID=7107 RepID=A0A922M9H1_SPOEX|nr:hypothetical protein HF086_014537 [Spodoptera exigua]
MPLEPAHDDTIQCLFFSPKLGSDSLLWDELCLQLNNSIKNLTQDYIWHRDEFIVYVKDNDGDFLLIESANFLQSWANPESTENRVFIHEHHIHIIQPEVYTLENKLELKEALKIISETPQLTRSSKEIQQAVLNRIGNYPEKLYEHIHKAVVELPSDLATLLTMKPTLVAPIVDAYCNHDIIDAKYFKEIDYKDCVTVEIKFTKFLYAMLLHSKLSNHAKQYIQTDNDKKKVLGLKLTLGLQIIMSRATDNIFLSKEYNIFLNNLKQNGYFKNNIEGSKEYNNLIEKAQQYFSTVESSVSSNVSQKISNLLASDNFPVVKNSVINTPAEHVNCGDNEDWLNVQPEQLNELLQNRYGNKLKLENDDILTSQRITKELSSFLNKTSDYEGIEPTRNEDSEQEIVFESDKFISCIEKMLNLLSTGEKGGSESEDSEDDFDITYNNENDNNDEDDDDDCDIELRTKLENGTSENLKEDTTVLKNIIQSMKEEKASTGPSSNLLNVLGVSKRELLDSDDE